MVLGPNGPLKRVFDVLWALISLAVLSPVMLLCALAVLIDDGWPVIFVQQRVGRHGKEFGFLKFRTMIRNAEKLGAGYEIVDNDNRITRTGNFLRRWSLDELPQLVNVVLGQMSIVGPRPTLAYQVEQYDAHQRRRLEVRPGLTGLAQISGRNNLSWPERIELDIKYIDNYNFWLDMQIILATFAVLTHSDGVYGWGWAKRPGEQPSLFQVRQEPASSPRETGNGNIMAQMPGSSKNDSEEKQ